MSRALSSLRAATSDRALRHQPFWQRAQNTLSLPRTATARPFRSAGLLQRRSVLPRVGEMELLRAVPILTVTDVDAAVQECSELLGPAVLMNLGWVATLGTSGGVQFSVMDIEQSASCNPQMSVEVPDVDVAYQRAQDSGVEIVHPLKDKDWGVRRFFLRTSAVSAVVQGSTKASRARHAWRRAHTGTPNAAVPCRPWSFPSTPLRPGLTTPQSLVRYTLTASDYWADLALRWAGARRSCYGPRGRPADIRIGATPRPSIRHRARRLSKSA